MSQKVEKGVVEGGSHFQASRAICGGRGGGAIDAGSWRSTCRPKRGGKKRSKYVQSVKRRQNVDPVILRHHFMPFVKINGNVEQIIYNMLPIDSGHEGSFA